MIDKLSYSFLGGPPLVKMATGEVISAEDLGGARVHTHVSGGADHFCKNQDEAIERVRDILSLEPPQKIHLHRYEERPPLVDPNERFMICCLLPLIRALMARAVLETISDDSHFVEYKKHYAPGRGDNILAGKIRIKGLPVGVIASNKIGIIFEEAARKAAEWIVRCSYEKIPILFLQASPGYMVGSESEHRRHRQIRLGYGAGGVLRPGAENSAGHRPGQRRGQLRHVRPGLSPEFSVSPPCGPGRRS